MSTIETRNTEWGFWGTCGDAAPAEWDKAVAHLTTEEGLTPERARDLLDSTFGRHLADQVLDGRPVRSILAHKGWQRSMRDILKLQERAGRYA